MKLTDEDRWLLCCARWQMRYRVPRLALAWGVSKPSVYFSTDETQAERHRQNDARWRRARPERHRAINARWRTKHPEKIRASSRTRRARERGAGGEGLPHWVELPWLVAHGAACAYCDEPLTESTLTVDHVLPLVLGGSHALSNLVPACHTCNSGKRCARVDTWRPGVAEPVRLRAAWVAALIGQTYGC